MKLEIHNLHKTYGNHKVLEDINLNIENGTIHCLLGKNGAGKTTLINLILELIQADQGSIKYDSMHDSLNTSLKKRIGIQGENNPIIEELSGYQYLKLTAKLYQVPSSVIEDRISDLSKYFFKEGELSKRLSSYSTGMKKKIGLCAAIIHTPDLLILDEPFSGLDPVAALEVIKFIKAYSKRDRSIFLASHDLNYVEKIASHISVLDEMKIIYDGTIEDFTSEGTNHIDKALMKILKPESANLEEISWI